jgi:hypothetical protein
MYLPGICETRNFLVLFICGLHRTFAAVSDHTTDFLCNILSDSVMWSSS